MQAPMSKIDPPSQLPGVQTDVGSSKWELPIPHLHILFTLHHGLFQFLGSLSNRGNVVNRATDDFFFRTLWDGSVGSVSRRVIHSYYIPEWPD